MKIKINKYILKNKKIKDNLTILNLSDIHSNINALNKVLKYTKNNNIDYILIPGDIIDTLNKENEKEFLNKLRELSNYSKIYISLGNHDKYLRKSKIKIIPLDKNEFKNTYFYKTLSKEKNIFFMINDYNFYDLKDITISSITLPNDYYFKKERKDIFDKYIENLDKEYKLDNKKFNIMLLHSPNCLIRNNKIINNSKLINNSNLIVCGHNHGGLTPTFIQDLFKNHIGIAGPFNKLFQKNAYGIYHEDNRNILISNGITKISDMASLKLLHKPINSILILEVDLIYLENGNDSFKLVDRSKYE